MNVTEFKEEILSHYIDPDLQISVNRNPGIWESGNGILHTSVFYSILAINNALTLEDISRFNMAIDLCWSGIDKPIVGLLERNNGREDLEAHDDYHIVTASMLLGTYHAEAIWNWGDTHCWSYNNQSPNKWTFRTWHKRFIGHVPYLYIAAKKRIDVFQKMALSLHFDLIDYSKADSAMMGWLKIQAIKKYGGLDMMVNKCENDLLDDCFSLGKALEPYFGKNHPFSKIPNLGLWE